MNMKRSELTSDIEYNVLHVVALSIHCQVRGLAFVQALVPYCDVRNFQVRLRRIRCVLYVRPETVEQADQLEHDKTIVGPVTVNGNLIRSIGGILSSCETRLTLEPWQSITRITFLLVYGLYSVCCH